MVTFDNIVAVSPVIQPNTPTPLMHHTKRVPLEYHFASGVGVKRTEEGGVIAFIPQGRGDRPRVAVLSTNSRPGEDSCLARFQKIPEGESFIYNAELIVGKSGTLIITRLFNAQPREQANRESRFNVPYTNVRFRLIQSPGSEEDCSIECLGDSPTKETMTLWVCNPRFQTSLKEFFGRMWSSMDYAPPYNMGRFVFWKEASFEQKDRLLTAAWNCFQQSFQGFYDTAWDEPEMTESFISALRKEWKKKNSSPAPSVTIQNAAPEQVLPTTVVSFDSLPVAPEAASPKVAIKPLTGKQQREQKRKLKLLKA